MSSLYEDVLWVMSLESGPDRIHVGSDELNETRLTGRMLMWLLLVSSGGIWGTTAWFIPHILLPSHPFHSFLASYFLSLTLHLDLNKNWKGKQTLFQAHLNTEYPCTETLCHSLLLNLTLSTFLHFSPPLSSFSSYPEAGEAAVNYSPTAPQHCRQPSSFTYVSADRQGGQASVDLLERGEAEGFPSHP